LYKFQLFQKYVGAIWKVDSFSISQTGTISLNKHSFIDKIGLAKAYLHLNITDNRHI